MSIAYPQYIHTLLFTITLSSILTLLFTYAVLFTMWYFSTITAQLTLHQCLQHILNIYIRYLFTITLPSILTLLFIYASFTQCDIFSQLLHNWLYNNGYSISATYTYSTVYNYSPMYTGFAVYIWCPFHNVIFFHNHCPIHSTTMLQHILNIYIQYCLQLHYPVHWLCCIYMLSFSQCDIFPQLLHNLLYNSVYSISSTYAYSTVYNYTTQ